MNIFDILRDYLLVQVDKYNLNMDMISIVSKSLSSKEAIGNTKRKDFPIIVGKEIMKLTLKELKDKHLLLLHLHLKVL